MFFVNYIVQSEELDEMRIVGVTCGYSFLK